MTIVAEKPGIASHAAAYSGTGPLAKAIVPAQSAIAGQRWRSIARSLEMARSSVGALEISAYFAPRTFIDDSRPIAFST
jgi:hypothetical protein